MRASAGLLLTAFVAALSAQEPPPPQTPPPFRSGTNLVRVDVTVTDRDGNLVRTLSADDFEVLEDGAPQAITSFKLLEATGQPTDDFSLPIRSPEHAAAEAARDDVRVFLIFWDEYHIGEFVSSLRAREQLTRFVLESFGPTDLVAFMDPLTTLDGIRFTRDRRALAEQVHKLKGRRGVYVPPRSVLEEAHLQYMRDIEGIRAQITVGALRAAMLHLASLREGRKSLILITESLGPLRDQTTRVLSDLMRTANDTNTAVVWVDPRGLQTGSMGMRPGISSSDVLESLSRASGGESISTNDMLGPLRRVVRHASAFYLLGYSAANTPMDGKFHQIKVRVKRNGMDVRARAGYWAPRATDVARARAATAAATPPPAVARAFAELPPEPPRRPAEFWIGFTPAADGEGSDVTIAWTPRAIIENRTAASVHVEATADALPVHSGPVDQKGVTFKASAGPLTLALTVHDANGDPVDREVRNVNVPQPSRATLALSTPVVFRARNPVELRALSEASPPVYAGREFQRLDQRVRVSVALYGSESDGAVVSARLLGVRGTALSELPVQAAGTAGLYHVDFTPSSISRGQFVIAIQAEKGAERAEAMVPFRLR